MMDFSLTTPGLLFPAISLLMLAYTNRFLGIASLIRSLHREYKDSPDPRLIGQIQNLRMRLILIRNMQALGVSSLFGCVVCVFVMFEGWVALGKVLFGLSLLLLMGSLALSLREIQMSVVALNLQLSDLESDAETG